MQTSEQEINYSKKVNVKIYNPRKERGDILEPSTRDNFFNFLN